MLGRSTDVILKSVRKEVETVRKLRLNKNTNSLFKHPPPQCLSSYSQLATSSSLPVVRNFASGGPLIEDAASNLTQRLRLAEKEAKAEIALTQLERSIRQSTLGKL